MSSVGAAPAAAPAPAPRLLRLENVGKTYGRHRALIDVSVTLAAGCVTAILGPNGAGKTTLLGILSTLVQPSSGTVSWAGQPLTMGALVRAAIGYVGHEPGVYGDLTARENLRLFAGLHGVANAATRADELLTRVGLGDVRPDAAARTFSRGMLQRLALARALLHSPEILLFDEPAAALDPAGAAWLVTELRRERDAGRAVVLVTHDLDAAAAVADHIVILRRARVVFDDLRPTGFPTEMLRLLYEERTRA